MMKNLFWGLFLGYSQYVSFAFANDEGPQIGDRPPALNLATTVQGPPAVAISWEKLQGKVVVVEFWNTRCGPCIAAIPHLNELVSEFTNEPVVFISITDDNPDHLQDFLKKKPMKGWLAVDGPLSPTRTAFGVVGIPHTVVVNKSGKVAAITHPAQLKAEHLREVLADQPCSLPTSKRIRPDNEESVPVSTPTMRIVEISISGPFPQPNGAFNCVNWNDTHTEFTAEKARLKSALAAYYELDEDFVILTGALPDGLYDLKISSPPNRVAELKSQFTAVFRTTFGFSVQTNTRVMEVYALTLSGKAAPNLKPAQKPGGGGQQPGGLRLANSRMSTIATFLGYQLDKPVINDVPSTNLWAMDLKWEMSAAERLPRKIYDQLGGDLGSKLCNDSPSTEPDAEALQTARAKLTPEDFAVLQTELSKPAKQRFCPDPAKVIKAAREQLGLELQATNRLVPVLEVSKAE